MVGRRLGADDGRNLDGADMMWASLVNYWQDFKAGREDARFLAAYVLVCLWFGWMLLA